MADQRPIRNLAVKIAKFWLSKSIFYVKNHPNHSNFFFHWKIWYMEHNFYQWHILFNVIFESLYLLNLGQNFKPLFQIGGWRWGRISSTLEFALFSSRNQSMFIRLDKKDHRDSRNQHTAKILQVWDPRTLGNHSTHEITGHSLFGLITILRLSSLSATAPHLCKVPLWFKK